jgi:hypothetical protein
MNWTVEWYRPERGGIEGIARSVQKLFFEGALTPRAGKRSVRRAPAPRLL